MPEAEGGWRWTAWVGPAVLFVHLLGAAPEFHGVWPDEQIYLDMARSLARGEGFRLDSLPLAPETAKYPPAWPLLLSCLLRAGVDADTTGGIFVVHALSAGFWAIAAQVAVSALVPGFGGGRSAQLMAGLLLTLNTVTMKLIPNGMSEGLFTAALTGALALGIGRAERPNSRTGLGLFALAALAALTRSVASPLLLLAALAALAARRWSLAAPLALAWLAQSLLVRLVRAGITPLSAEAERVVHYYVSYREHLAYYSAPALAGDIATFQTRLLSTVIHNAGLAGDSLGTLVYPARMLGIEEGASGTTTTGVVGLATLAAALACGRHSRAARAAGAFLLAYAAVFVAWTWPFSSRFWLPVFPLVLALVAAASCQFGNIPRLLAWPLTGLLLLGNVMSPVYRLMALWQWEGGLAARQAAADESVGTTALRGLVRPDDVILGPHFAPALGRGVPARAMELEALLPADLRLGLMLGHVSSTADATELASELDHSLRVLLGLLPADATVWVVVNPALDSSGQRRLAPLLTGLVEKGRIEPALDTPNARAWRVTRHVDEQSLTPAL